MKIPRLVLRPRAARRLMFTLMLALAVAAVGSSVSGGGVAAQGQGPCALLTADEIQTLAPKQQVENGVASAAPSLETFSCRYAWGSGIERFNLTVSVSPASRMFAGRNVVAIREGLLSSVVPETSDTAVSDVGEAAVFRAHSAMFVGANAFVKDRILQLNLEGFDAREMKSQLISLLKAAASRL